MNALKLWVSIIAVFLAAAGGLFGQEREFPDYNFAITPPAGWQLATNVPARPGLLATFGNADKTRFVLLVVYDNTNASGPIDDRFATEFERGLESSGAAKRTWGKFIEVRGIKSYERLGNAAADGNSATLLIQVIPVDGRAYALQGVKVGGDASNDPEIRRCLASFRFITPPVALTASRSPESVAFKIGFFVGVLVVVGIVIVLRKRKRIPATPPPLPPSG